MYLYTHKEGVKIIMPDGLRKINYNRTKKDIDKNIPWFSIHSSTIERTLFKEDTTARTMFEFPYTVPKYSYWIENNNIYKNWLNEFKNFPCTVPNYNKFYKNWLNEFYNM